MSVPEPYATFEQVARYYRDQLLQAPPVRTERWQGKDVSKDPAATTYEVLNACFQVDLMGVENLLIYKEDIRPNLPWADDHFQERVGGEPLNPGAQWASWPWAGSAAKFKTERFNHTYMERLWPAYARRTDDGKLPLAARDCIRKYPSGDKRPKHGIGYYYGDLQSLVEMLAQEPHTRQAWIPLFFPEDTGVGDGGRKPCTLGYQVIVRGDRAHMYYPLRSCDFVRHWRDDCYLAVRLLLWMIDRCRELSPERWGSIVPGTYSMHMTSLHIFENDRREMLRG